MLKQQVTFTDFDGNKRTTTLYFNLTEEELVSMQTESERGIDIELKDLQDELTVNPEHRDTMRKLLAFVKNLVHKSYGVKSDDGIHFRKTPDILEDFVNSAMYSELLLGLFQDGGEKVTAFITGIMPPDLVARATAQISGGNPDVKEYAPSARETFQNVQRDRNVPAPVIEDAPAFNPPPTIGQQEFQAPITPTQPETQSFRVREEPMQDPEQAKFEEWKRQQAQAEADSVPRPPHESGPGFVQQ